MPDDIDRLVKAAALPRGLTLESTRNAIELLDHILGEGEGADSGFFGSWEYVRQARAAAEQFVHDGYRYTKCAVLVPTTVFGLVHGLSFPDSDISVLGIGHHRFFLFHSAIGLVMLRYFYKQWLDKQTEPAKWSNRVKRKVAGGALGGFAMGVGVHLAIDVFQPKSVVFPFVGSLVEGTLVDDNIWLLANSIWAFKIAHDVFVLSLADELDAAKVWVAQHFTSGVQDDQWPAGFKTIEVA